VDDACDTEDRVVPTLPSDDGSKAKFDDRVQSESIVLSAGSRGCMLSIIQRDNEKTIR
jgi:hypothetical protein